MVTHDVPAVPAFGVADGFREGEVNSIGSLGEVVRRNRSV